MILFYIFDFVIILFSQRKMRKQLPIITSYSACESEYCIAPGNSILSGYYLQQKYQFR